MYIVQPSVLSCNSQLLANKGGRLTNPKFWPPDPFEQFSKVFFQLCWCQRPAGFPPGPPRWFFLISWKLAMSKPNQLQCVFTFLVELALPPSWLSTLVSSASESWSCRLPLLGSLLHVPHVPGLLTNAAQWFIQRYGKLVHIPKKISAQRNS